MASDDPEFQDRISLADEWGEHVDLAMKDLLEVVTEAEAAIIVNGALRGLPEPPTHGTFREFHQRTEDAYNFFKKRPPLKCEACGKCAPFVTEVQQVIKKDMTPGRYHLLCPDCRDGQRITVGVDFGENDRAAMVVMAYDPVSKTSTVLDVREVETGQVEVAPGPPINDWIRRLAARK